MKIIKGKKGISISQYSSEWIINAMLLAFIVVFSILFFNFLVKADVHSESVRAENFISRILYSENGFSYHDDLGKLHTKTIDLEKYKTKDPDTENSALLEDTIDFGSQEFIAAKITLTDLKDDQKVCPFDSGLSCSQDHHYDMYYNKKKFNEWVIYGFDRTKFYKLDKQIYVLIKGEDNLVPGRLNIQVVTPVG